MPLNIIKAADRMAAKKKINAALLSEAGMGKTTQCRTLDPAKTIAIDMEAGTLALGDWQGDVIDLRAEANRNGCQPWEIVQGIATLIGGPDPLELPNGPYSKEAAAAYAKAICDPREFDKYDTIFVDSLTVASRWGFAWSAGQPDSFNKEGKPDTRGTYGLLGREMIRFVTHLQHCPKSCIFACILELKTDKLERAHWQPQVMGDMTARELPGIIDQVITLTTLNDPSVGSYRAFVNHKINPWNFPAKDRSGCLDLLEPPDLGALMAKIRAGKRIDSQMAITMPAPAEKKPEPEPASQTTETKPA